MKYYQNVLQRLVSAPKVWLITGVAGFIGSNLLEALLKLDQRVVGIDNFVTGYEHNLTAVRESVTANQWNRFKFINGDICDASLCRNAVKGIDYVLHQAALGSVPRSIVDPLMTNHTNIHGFLTILTAAKDENVLSFTYAASSSTYGDLIELPKVEERIGAPLSPYAVTKYVNELYAEVYERNYDFKAVGLRYFNVFGPRQDPNGEYAAVVPRWAASMIKDETVFINGDGETSRDFCYISNVIQMNILAATASSSARGEVYNVAVGGRTSLNSLYAMIQKALNDNGVTYTKSPVYRDFRAGDVRHSQASIDKAVKLLGFSPESFVQEGISQTIRWYCSHHGI